MKKIICFFILLLSTVFVGEQAKAQPVQPEIKIFTIQAEVAKIRGNYILRAEKPAEVFTVLNPDPEQLDDLISKGRTVRVEVQVVRGDNVRIKNINGKNYQVEPKVPERKG